MFVQVRKIAHIMLEETKQRVATKGIELAVGPRLLERIIADGYSLEYGVRPLRQVSRTHLAYRADRVHCFLCLPGCLVWFACSTCSDWQLAYSLQQLHVCRSRLTICAVDCMTDMLNPCRVLLWLCRPSLT